MTSIGGARNKGLEPPARLLPWPGQHALGGAIRYIQSVDGAVEPVPCLSEEQSEACALRNGYRRSSDPPGRVDSASTQRAAPRAVGCGRAHLRRCLSRLGR